MASLQQGEDVVDHFAEPHIRADVGLGMLLHQLTLGVDGEDSIQGHSHLLVGIHIGRPVPKSSIKGLCVWEKQVFDVCQTLDFELFWLLFNHFSVQGGEEAAGAQQKRPLWQHCAPLVDPVQIAPRHVCHPNGTCRTIEKLVAILAYFVIQLCDALVSPILSQCGQYVTKSIRSKQR